MRRCVSVALFGAAALLAACGGSGASLPQPASAQITEPFAGTAGSPAPFALPGAGGYSGTILLTPAARVSGVTLSLTMQTGPGGNIPAPTDSDQPLAFVGLAMSSDVGLAGMPAFAFVAPDSVLQNIGRRPPQTGDASLLLAFFDPDNPSAGYQFDVTCTLNGVTIICNGTNTPFNLLAFLQYVFELKQHHGPPPTPAPGPSGGGTTVITVPTPAPIVCSPSPDGVAVGQSNVIDCTESGYGGAFTWSVADPAIASVQLSDNLTFTFFTVTGLAPGTTTLTLHSQPGGTGSLSITVAP
jgi:hypothetical protein